MANALKSFDPAAIIRSCLSPAWVAVDHVDGIEIRRATSDHRLELVGYVRPDPNRPWKCAPVDANGKRLGPAVSPSEAAEAVARAALKAEAAHA